MRWQAVEEGGVYSQSLSDYLKRKVRRCDYHRLIDSDPRSLSIDKEWVGTGHVILWRGQVPWKSGIPIWEGETYDLFLIYSFLF